MKIIRNNLLLPIVWAIFMIVRLGLSNNIAMAASTEEIVHMAEEKIAEMQHWNDVALNLNINSTLIGRDDLELVRVDLLPSGRTAKVIVKSGTAEYSISGSYDKAIMLPMLVRAVEKGEAIQDSDVQLMKWQARHHKPHHIKDMGELVGKQAIRRIPAYRPIRTNDLHMQIAIDKGRYIKLVFKRKAVMISARGEALQSGAVGDMIKVKNIDSGKVIVAEVMSRDVVEVKE